VIRPLAFLVLLMAGWCAFPAAISARSIVLPPQEIVGKIREVDRGQGRVVMEERGLEVWATDTRQLDGLTPGQRVRLRFQQQDGKQVIYSIAPLPQ
jgi:hypothetical protein